MENEVRMKSKDVFFGIGIIVFVGIFYSQTVNLPPKAAEFPRVLLALMLIAAVGIIVRSLWRQKKGKAEEREEKSISFKEFVLIALIPSGILFAICALMTVIGFYLGCFLLFIVIYILQDVIIKGKFSLKRKDVITLLISTTAICVVFYVCFSVLLRLPVPIGPWGF
ncbi:tripartite tricarboxylate transporter TctB family protein [Breznakiella homolactica]|uniref:Tripartite tricarboxylate transporter TctB family protein n=1 Tax=Breznakiella homolactica TaxID=2798577 RepID=A0A7T8BBV0_9SPIR|nr:tripartite tricarboxylate transporter TctB family protein [Breznakiella homolactica]QQO09573.1 tripartite tricarboxylate transporter TctB family protein [Breznakiella homolactica]